MLTKPLDRINEAYNGDMGSAFSEKTRERVNWIVNHTKGNVILDIGCSQGIIPIILGREGKMIDAIDIAEESIQYAKNALINEHISVQNNVAFRVSNFMTETDLKDEYETVLLTEVLEHISDPEQFLKKIHKYLSTDGQLIVTVPFGINDYFDHKRTYYFLDLYDQLSVFFHVENVHYLGKWTGVVCKKRKEYTTEKITSFNRIELEKLELGFYKIERELIERINNQNNIIRDKNVYINNLEKNQKQLKAEIEERIKENLQSKTIIESLEKDQVQNDDRNISKINFMEKLDEIQNKLKEELDYKNIQLQNKESIITTLQRELNDLRVNLVKSFDSEREAIKLAFAKEDETKKYKETNRKSKERIEIQHKKEIAELTNKYSVLQKKYVSLKKSKLGSLTTKYWELRNKLRKKARG
ncbi:methyltransferase domain-containing protein [Bacillus sp. FJAT-49732]|uniref:Methyltransferase domain-containing protein n=1 Tax=Lederbergia citrisecunda TaxID=2833583 RepID=A0A942TN47_9BACI|nr:methyltransferase domain-containing protein [Lederbergia citrisecunda]MBS4200635.1 methyltransferase domain-containing protein [Lederbergia citrisecunda]